MRITCKRFKKAHQVDSPMDSAMREHLDCCASCGQYAEQWIRLAGLLREFPKVTPPPLFEAQVKARIESRKRTQGEGILAWLAPSPAARRYAWAAAWVVVGAVGMIALRELGPLPGSPPGSDVPKAQHSIRAPEAAEAVAERKPYQQETRPSAVEDAVAGGSLRRVALSSAMHRREPAREAALNDEIGLTLLVQDLASHELRVIKVPQVVVGAQPILPSSAKLIGADVEAVY